MEFSSTESEGSEERAPQAQIKKEAPKLLASFCLLAWHVRRTLAALARTPFLEQEHATPYNLYMREKEKTKDALELFCALTALGVRARIVHSVGIEKAPSASLSLEILSGKNVISTAETGTADIVVSIDNRGSALNHSLYVPKSATKALDRVFARAPQGEGPFAEHDRRRAEQLPKTKREALLHPLYRMDRKSKREVIYPKGCGWVGSIAERGRARGAQRPAEHKIYPASHVCRLLTQRELTRANRAIEPGTLPFRTLASKGAPERPVKLYAPWQTQPAPRREGVVVSSADIPEGHVYLVETPHVSYGRTNLGAVPAIGKRYDYATNAAETVRGGVLLPRETYEARKEEIKREIAQNVVRSFAAAKQDFFLNIQLVAKRSLAYLDLLDALQRAK